MLGWNARGVEMKSSWLDELMVDEEVFHGAVTETHADETTPELDAPSLLHQLLARCDRGEQASGSARAAGERTGKGGGAADFGRLDAVGDRYTVIEQKIKQGIGQVNCTRYIPRRNWRRKGYKCFDVINTYSTEQAELNEDDFPVLPMPPPESDGESMERIFVGGPNVTNPGRREKFEKWARKYGAVMQPLPGWSRPGSKTSPDWVAVTPGLLATLQISLGCV